MFALFSVSTVTFVVHIHMIIRCLASRNTDLLVHAFNTYVRPLLEYNSVVWSPYLKSDIELIQKVQRRFTKRLKGFSELSYDDRLKLLNLERLEIRRLRFDLLCCYKIIFGHRARIDREAFFELRIRVAQEVILTNSLNTSVR